MHRGSGAAFGYICVSNPSSSNIFFACHSDTGDP